MSIPLLDTRSYLVEPFFSDGQPGWNINPRVPWNETTRRKARRGCERDEEGLYRPNTLTPRATGGREGDLLISPTLCPTFLTISRSCCLTSRVSYSPRIHFLSYVQPPISIYLSSSYIYLFFPFVLLLICLKNVFSSRPKFFIFFLFRI